MERPTLGQEEEIIFVGEAYSIAKNQSKGSEDAYFITDKGVGVSDGVGSWSKYGIDCALFSGTLMRECSKFISRIIVRQHQSFADPKVTRQEMECHRQALESKLPQLFKSL
jgi:hypothetical protein